MDILKKIAVIFMLSIMYLVDSMIDSIVTPSPTPTLLLRGKPAIMTTLCHVAGGVSLLRRPLPAKTVNTIIKSHD